MAFPDTNIEMLDSITESRKQWNAATKNGTQCCGEDFSQGGYCDKNPLYTCVLIFKAREIVYGVKKDDNGDY